MKIGNVALENNVFLAPMAGVTDLPFRILCKEMGCGLVYSEMVSAKGILYDNKNTTELLEVDPKERPVAVQLFGSDPEILGAMAKKIEEDIIDVNMGCPAPKIVKNGEGSCLMKTPELVGKIVRSLVESQKKPVTIKFRKGFDEEHINAVEIAKIAEANGASRWQCMAEPESSITAARRIGILSERSRRRCRFPSLVTAISSHRRMRKICWSIQAAMPSWLDAAHRAISSPATPSTASR